MNLAHYEPGGGGRGGRLGPPRDAAARWPGSRSATSPTASASYGLRGADLGLLPVRPPARRLPRGDRGIGARDARGGPRRLHRRTAAAVGVGIDRPAPRDPHRPLLPADRVWTQTDGHAAAEPRSEAPGDRDAEHPRRTSSARLGRAAGAGRDERHLLQGPARGEQHLRLGAVGRRLHRPDDEDRAAGGRLPHPAEPPAVLHRARGRRRVAAPQPRVVRAAAHPRAAGREGAADGREPRLEPRPPRRSCARMGPSSCCS